MNDGAWVGSTPLSQASDLRDIWVIVVSIRDYNCIELLHQGAASLQITPRHSPFWIWVLVG
jgi:hypothetical protein